MKLGGGFRDTFVDATRLHVGRLNLTLANIWGDSRFRTVSCAGWVDEVGFGRMAVLGKP